MKVSQNWLKELVDINTTPEQLSEKLSIGGFEVESLVDTSSKFKGIVLGHVLSVVKHSNSDKLSICKVDIGTDQLQIICGFRHSRGRQHWLAIANSGEEVGPSRCIPPPEGVSGELLGKVLYKPLRRQCLRQLCFHLRC